MGVAYQLAYDILIFENKNYEKSHKRARRMMKNRAQISYFSPSANALIQDLTGMTKA